MYEGITEEERGTVLDSVQALRLQLANIINRFPKQSRKTKSMFTTLRNLNVLSYNLKED